MHYALEGSIAVAGSAIKWVRDSLKLIEKAEEIGPLAAEVEDAGGVYFVTAFSGLFCPYWDDSAAGTIVVSSIPFQVISKVAPNPLSFHFFQGITSYTDRRHLCRATIEATCYQTQAILEAMAKDSGIHLKALQVDGGMTNSDEAMQIQADILGLTVERPEMRESTALGSAIMAGSAVGLFGWDVNKPQTLKDVNTAGKQKFEPIISKEKRSKGRAGWERAIERARGWNEDETGTAEGGEKTGTV